MEKVQSKDGTEIAFERVGSGPAVILVDGALCSRAFGPMPKLAPLLARHFTVFLYDRRGRGESGDTRPYSAMREVEDIAALIGAAGGRASLVGLSSGGALALEAAASNLPIAKVVAYEPPYVLDERHAKADHAGRLGELLAADRRGAAVHYFMHDMVGIPAPFAYLMRLMPRMWKQLKAVAHTLPYDAVIMGDFRPPARFSSIRVPALAMHGEKSDVKLRNAVQAVAALVPNVQCRSLPGQTHNVKLDVLAPELVEFLST